MEYTLTACPIFWDHLTLSYGMIFELAEAVRLKTEDLTLSMEIGLTEIAIVNFVTAVHGWWVKKIQVWFPWIYCFPRSN